MKTSRLVLAAAALATASLGAFADDADSSQYAVRVNSTKTRAQVQAELSQYKQAGVNPWSIAYNPLKGFRSQATRSQKQAEYIAARDRVNAMTAEDSGSAYLATHRPAVAPAQYAGKAVIAR